MRFGAKFIATDFEPTYNAAPSQLLPVILGRNPLGSSNKEIVLARWGFQPAWAKHWRPQNNARVEGIEHKPMFRDAYKGRHCLVLADGFYEWKTSGKAKQPFRFTLKSGEPFAMAGIWEKPDFDDEVPTFAILTTAANELVAGVHDRMPIILPRTYEQRWLLETGYGHMNPPLTYPPELMLGYPVSTKVNKASFNEPAAIAPLEPEIL